MQIEKIRILVLIPTLRDNVLSTIEALLRQTIKPTDIVVICGDKEFSERLREDKRFITLHHARDSLRDQGTNIVRALNFALDKFALSNYDYLFRCDADIVFPSDFFERNLPDDNKKYISFGDDALFFFKSSDFNYIMGGKFAEMFKEDTYTLMKFWKAGFTPRPWNPAPTSLKPWGQGKNYRYFLSGGESSYTIGYSFLISSLASLAYCYRFRNPMFIFGVLGYLRAYLRHEEKSDVADFVYRTRGRPDLSKLRSFLSKTLRARSKGSILE